MAEMLYARYLLEKFSSGSSASRRERWNATLVNNPKIARDLESYGRLDWASILMEYYRKTSQSIHEPRPIIFPRHSPPTIVVHDRPWSFVHLLRTLNHGESVNGYKVEIQVAKKDPKKIDDE